MSIVRNNLLTQKGYTPYCGSEHCTIMPRTRFNGEQFKCHSCGWKSTFEKSFIIKYQKFNSLETLVL